LGRIGVLARRQHVEDVGLIGVLADVGATHGDGDDLGAAGLDRGTVSSMSLYLPVPTSRRELKVRSAMTSGSFSAVMAILVVGRNEDGCYRHDLAACLEANQPPPMACTISTRSSR
jgi:hypothetical protein